MGATALANATTHAAKMIMTIFAGTAQARPRTYSASREARNNPACGAAADASQMLSRWKSHDGCLLKAGLFGILQGHLVSTRQLSIVWRLSYDVSILVWSRVTKTAVPNTFHGHHFLRDEHLLWSHYRNN